MTTSQVNCPTCGAANAAQETRCSVCDQPLSYTQPERQPKLTRRAMGVISLAGFVGLATIGTGVTFLVRAMNATQDMHVITASDTLGGLTWSPDSKRIASCDSTGKVQIWEVINGQPLQAFAGPSAVVGCGPMSIFTEIAWSPDGRFIALGTSSGPVEIRDVSTGKILTSLTIPPADAGTANSNYLAWSPDGRYIAAADASMGGQFAVWARDNWTQTLARQMPGSYSEIRGLAWSPDSKKLLITGDITRNNKVLGQALIWDIHTDTSFLTKQVGIGDSDGPLLDSGKGVNLALSEPTWSSDGRAFAIGVNQQALIFSISGQPLSMRGTYAPYGSHPTLAWSPTNTQRLAGILPPDSAIAVWNPFTNQLIHTYTRTRESDGTSCVPQSTAFAWSPNGKFIASTEENVVHVWRPE